MAKGRDHSAPTEQRLAFAEKFIVIAGGIVASMALTVLSPVMPSIEHALAHDAFDRMLVKQLFGAVTLAMVIGAPLGGFLVAKVGIRRLLLGASLVFAIAGTAGFFLSSLPLLLVSRMFVGASAACIQVMSLTLVNVRLAGVDRARWMGLHIAVATLCSLVIFPISGLLGQISWRLPFFEYLFGLVVFVTLLAGRQAEAPPALQAAAAARTGAADGSMLRWMPWHYVALSLTTGAITFLPAIYSPFLFREKIGLGPGGIAAVMTGTALVGGTTALLYGRGRRYLSVHQAFVCCFGMAALGMLIVSLANTLPEMLAGFLIYCTGTAWFVPNVMTSLGGKLAPHQQARAAGLVKAGQFLSTPLCVLAVEPYAARFGAVSVMRLVCAIAAFVLMLMLARIAQLRGGRPGGEAKVAKLPG